MLTTDDKLLTRKELAELLRLKIQTLNCWAVTGDGPKITYIGARGVRYKLSDVNEWIEQSNRK